MQISWPALLWASAGPNQRASGPEARIGQGTNDEDLRFRQPAAHRLASPRLAGALPPINGFFMTTKPDLSKRSTRRLATTADKSSSEPHTRLRPLKDKRTQVRRHFWWHGEATGFTRWRLNGVEPFFYIANVMQKVAQGWPNSRIDELMPWAAAPIDQEKNRLTIRRFQTTLTIRGQWQDDRLGRPSRIRKGDTPARSSAKT